MRPHDLPAADRFAHGVRARYVTGCRCEPCTIANRTYARDRSRANRRGDVRVLVDAEPVRLHLEKLSRAGVGFKAVANYAGVGHTVLLDIKMRRQLQLRSHHAEAILAVSRKCYADGARIPANRTWRLLNKLQLLGLSKAEIARRLGMKSPAIQFRRDVVVGNTEQRVLALVARMKSSKRGLGSLEREAEEAAERIVAPKRIDILENLRGLLWMKNSKGARVA